MAEFKIEDAITKDSLLPKLRFLRHGKDNEKQADQFNSEVLKFHRQAKVSITKQAVRNWFGEKNSTPSGHEANLFLRRYFESMEHSDLTKEQNIVRVQLEKYFKHFTLRPNQHKIRLTKEGYLQFHMTGRVKDILRTTDSITGIYLTYKSRFSENFEKPVAQEVLHIFMSDHDLRFEHWYVRQGNRISKFEGSILPLDKLLWFFGVTVMEPDRIRVMSLSRTDELNNVYDKYRWGILHSDVPFESHDPAACRILLTAAPLIAAGDIERFAQENVKHLALEELPSANRPIIERLIDNHQTALSVPRSLEPAVNRDGPLIDSILKVDQQTMRVAVDRWAGKLEPGESSEIARAVERSDNL